MLIRAWGICLYVPLKVIKGLDFERKERRLLLSTCPFAWPSFGVGGLSGHSVKAACNPLIHSFAYRVADTFKQKHSPRDSVRVSCL